MNGDEWKITKIKLRMNIGTPRIGYMGQSLHVYRLPSTKNRK